MKFHERVMGVYFDDLDPFGILHNARYLLLFERTLGSFWASMGFGGMQAKDAPDLIHLVRANTVEYLSPVSGTCDVRVRVWVERIGRTSLTFAFSVRPLDEDREHARGTRTIVRVDPETFEARPWTQGFRERMSTWLA